MTGSISDSDYYRQKEQSNQIIPLTDFWFQLSNKKKYQEAVDQFVAELKKLQVGDPEEDVQRIFNNFFQIVDSHLGITTEDTSKRVYLDGRKPDLSHHSTFDILNPMTVLVIGELKKPRQTPVFSDGQKGEICSCARKALNLHAKRERIYSYLSDGKVIQFFLTRRERNNISVIEFFGPILLIEDGIWYLLALLSQKRQSLGAVHPKTTNFKTPVKLTKFLVAGESTNNVNAHSDRLNQFSLSRSC